MNILHVISGLDVGGAEMFLLRLATELQRRGANQVVVSLSGRGSLADRFEEIGVPIFGMQSGSPLRGLAAIRRLRGIAHDLRPHVIQGWMYHGNLAASLVHRLIAKQGRLFWGIRCSDIDQSGYSLRLRASVRLGAWMSAGPDIVIANSQAGAEVHSAMGYAPHRMLVIPNGVDVDRFRPDLNMREAVRTELEIPLDARVLMQVARVDPMKDHANLLTALSQTPGVIGVLIGAGTEQLRLPPSVMALGRRGDVARLLTAGDIIVSPSAFGEGFPNALAEGMSCGLVPVATDVGDSRLIVGDTGEIVPRRDPAFLAAGIRRVLSWPDKELHEMGVAARARIVRQFTLNRAVDRFDELYRLATTSAGEMESWFPYEGKLH